MSKDIDDWYNTDDELDKILDYIGHDGWKGETDEEKEAYIKKAIKAYTDKARVYLTLDDIDDKYDRLSTRQKEILVDYHYKQVEKLQAQLKGDKK